MRPDREERRRLSEEQEAELRAERAKAAASDHERVRRAQRFGWSGTTNKTRPVPCRDCGEPVQLSEYVDLLVGIFNPYLSRIGEPPLEDGELTRCDACGVKWRERQAERAAFERNEAWKILKKPIRPTEFELAWLERAGFREWADVLRERWAPKTSVTKPKNTRQRRLELVEEEP